MFGYQIGTQLFIFYYSLIDYSISEPVTNYCMIRNWLFGDHLFCNGFGNQLFSNVRSSNIC